MNKKIIKRLFDTIDIELDKNGTFKHPFYDRAVLKIQTLFKMGYVPSRSDAFYTNVRTCNCLGHAVFNFDNDVIEMLFKGEEITEFFILDDFITKNKDIPKVFVKYVEDFGLDIRACKLKEKPEENQWKVGVYSFSNLYHFLLQKPEMPWGKKPGWFYNQRIVDTDIPPKKIFNYFLDKTYMITNPYYNKVNENQLEN